jgi:hypothetical protein
MASGGPATEPRPPRRSAPLRHPLRSRCTPRAAPRSMPPAPPTGLDDLSRPSSPGPGPTPHVHHGSAVRPGSRPSRAGSPAPWAGGPSPGRPAGCGPGPARASNGREAAPWPRVAESNIFLKAGQFPVPWSVQPPRNGTPVPLRYRPTRSGARRTLAGSRHAGAGGDPSLAVSGLGPGRLVTPGGLGQAGALRLPRLCRAPATGHGRYASRGLGSNTVNIAEHQAGLPANLKHCQLGPPSDSA